MGVLVMLPRGVRVLAVTRSQKNSTVYKTSRERDILLSHYSLTHTHSLWLIWSM